MTLLRSELVALAGDPDAYRQAIQVYFQYQNAIYLDLDSKYRYTGELEKSVSNLQARLQMQLSTRERSDEHLEYVDNSVYAIIDSKTDAYSDVVYLIQQELEAERAHGEALYRRLSDAITENQYQKQEIVHYNQLLEALKDEVRLYYAENARKYGEIEILTYKLAELQKTTPQAVSIHQISSPHIVSPTVPPFSPPVSYCSRKSPLVRIVSPAGGSAAIQTSLGYAGPVQQNNFIFVNGEDLRANFAIYEANIPHLAEFGEDIRQIVTFVANLQNEQRDDIAQLLDCQTKDCPPEEQIFSFLQCLMTENQIGGRIANIMLDGANAASLLACDLCIAFMLGYVPVYKPGRLMPDLVLGTGEDANSVTEIITGW